MSVVVKVSTHAPNIPDVIKINGQVFPVIK
jgi:hypothetical protein